MNTYQLEYIETQLFIIVHDIINVHQVIGNSKYNGRPHIAFEVTHKWVIKNHLLC